MAKTTIKQSFRQKRANVIPKRCQWKVCNGLIIDHGKYDFPRFRCVMCGRSPDMEYELRVVDRQALHDRTGGNFHTWGGNYEYKKGSRSSP